MAAALEQAEELSRAAADIGPAARPLLLFYALSQAGRAIAAVHIKDGWETSSHGLRWPGAAGGEPITERCVEPDPGRKGLFGRISTALGSEPLTKPVKLGAVWSALPELALPALPTRKSEWRVPLYLYPTSDADADSRLRGSQLTFLVVGLRDLRTPEAVIGELAHYPSGQDGRPQCLPGGDGPMPIVEYSQAANAYAPRVVWHADDATVAALDAKFDEIAPPYQGTLQRALIPRLPNGDYLHPLALWWLVLFGLSNIARYEPDVWVRTLDVDQNALAVPVESAMEEALDSIPHLVLEAIFGEHIAPRSYPPTDDLGGTTNRLSPA